MVKAASRALGLHLRSPSCPASAPPRPLSGNCQEQHVLLTQPLDALPAFFLDLPVALDSDSPALSSRWSG